MSEFFKKLKQLKFDFIFDERAIQNSWIYQSTNWFLYWILMFWVILAFKYYVRYNLKMGYIRIQFGDWVAIHYSKDFHAIMFLLFVFNFFFCIIWFHIEQTKENWFTFDESIKSPKDIPDFIKETWIYKYIYLYISNFNVFLFFFCLVESDHLFRVVFLPLEDGLFVLSVCIIIHVTFWINYFFNYSKRK